MTIEVVGPPNGVLPTKSADESNQPQTQTSSAEGEDSPSQSSSDTVRLTDTAAQLRNLESRLAVDPAVDTQRVEAVKQALADGSFQVDANQTAEKILGFETAIGGDS